MTAQMNIATNLSAAAASDETVEQIERSIESLLDSIETTDQIVARAGRIAHDPADALCSADEIEGKLMESPEATEARAAHYIATGETLPIPGFEALYSNALVGMPRRSDHVEREAAFEAALDAECEALLTRLMR